jgi:hypothetical protein
MSCLFNSLSYFIRKSSYDIRQDVCNYLERNMPIIEGLDTHFILSLENPNYISHMRRTSTWGGAIEIQAACNIWNTRIIVYNIRDRGGEKIEFLPIRSDSNSKLDTMEITWSGGHYEPIRR